MLYNFGKILMKIKFKNIEEAKDGDDISSFYKPDGEDRRKQGEIGTQMPTYKMNNPLGNIVSGDDIYDKTPNRAYPAQSNAEEELELDEDLLFEELIYEKKDRCYHLAKQKYDVFPSAYASGFIVRCRRGKVGRKKSRVKMKEGQDIEEGEGWSDKRKESIDCDHPNGFSERAYCDGKEKNNESISLEDLEIILQEGTFDREKSQGLHGWFARAGGKKGRGWVDCNTCRTNPKTGRKTCKTCGRQSGEQRSKYPACRPTPSACTRAGMRRKKSSMRVSLKSKKKKEE